MKRTPLKSYTLLRRYTPLKAKKGLNRMSNRAKVELEVWLRIKRERMQKLLDKFGYVPCELCMKRVGNIYSERERAEAHHNNHNRRQNEAWNCRILHAYCNRIVVEDNNIKDVPSLL
jgi:hypothetical protein